VVGALALVQLQTAGTYPLGFLPELERDPLNPRYV